MRAALEHYHSARKSLDDLAVNSAKTPIHPQYVTRVRYGSNVNRQTTSVFCLGVLDYHAVVLAL